MRSTVAQEKPTWPQPVEAMGPRGSYLAQISPNSSAEIALSVVADLHDVLAALRTAALFARSFEAKLSVDVLGMKPFAIDPNDREHETSIKKILHSVHAHLRELVSSDASTFVLETNLTAASFLAINSVVVRVHRRSAIQRSDQG
jgi:hypothetical protein